MNWHDRIKPGIHGFAERISRLPPEHLGRDGYQLTYSRKRWLSPEDSRSLISENQALTLVIAKLGSAFRWYDQGDYRFWENEGSEHIADPEGFSLEDFPDGRAYLASEWICDSDPESEKIILFEQHH